jgi:anti-sigma B factor antagonist
MTGSCTVQIRSRVQGDVAVVVLSGRLTVNDNPGELKDAVAEAVRKGARHVVIDLGNVGYIDSTRLGELIAAHITVSRLGSHLTLAGTPPRVMELLTLAGLGNVFERFATVDEAIASLDAPHD